jgi:hypothetical protein
MRHEWIHTGKTTESPIGDGPDRAVMCEIICIACQDMSAFVQGTRSEEELPHDPRNRTDCRGAAWHDRNRKASRERLKRLREQGLCQTCGLNPCAAGKDGDLLTRCEPCRVEHNEGEKLRKSIDGETE